MSRPYGRYLLIALVIPTAALAESNFTADNHLAYLPRTPPLIRQTDASERFHLYGDRDSVSYQDADLDGIDDLRVERRRDLAAMFSPVLFKSTCSVPRDVDEMLRPKYVQDRLHDIGGYRRLHFDKEPIVSVDTWDTSKGDGRLICSSG